MKRIQEEQALQSVIGSQTFSKSPNLAKLLNYVCAKYWAGAGGELKEYRIAVEALGRSADFDPLTNSTVRVELHRLRQKLKQFYESEGSGHEVVIALNAGSYIPRFTHRPGTVPESNAASLHLIKEAPDQQCEAAASGHQGQNSTASNFWRWRNRSLWAVSLFCVALAVFLILWGPGHWKALPAANVPGASKASSPATSTSSTALPNDSVGIIAGYLKSDYIDRAGDIWGIDRYYHGGIGATQFFHRPVSRTLDPVLFESYRTGDFSYDIPLKHAPYEVRLYFMETRFGPGTLLGGGEASRIFDVWINGKIALGNFDPYTDAGGNFVADIRTFKDVVPAADGLLHLRFTSIKDKPFVNAIEILPDPGGKLLPIRIVAQDNSFTDSKGRVWKPDSYFRGGVLAANSAPVQGTPDPGLYAGERYGIFSYALPVAPGKYAVILRFAETFFGPGKPGKGGVGSRVFNVFCNGRVLLRNFDILREAGGDNRALVRRFNGIEPNSQGKILLRFVPVQNYALVNSIQVVDQSP